MARVREVTYYAPGVVDHDLIAALTERMKNMWHGEVKTGVVFSGEYVNHLHTTIDFASWDDFANLQDNWESNAEWLSFLAANSSNISPVVHREIVLMN